MEGSGGYDGGAESDADRRQRDHGREIALELAPAQVERRLEEERRQDEVEDEIVGQRQACVDPKRGERCACKHEADRVGQPKPPRGERNENREAEQTKGAEEQDIHGACLAVGSKKRNLARALFRSRQLRAGS